MRWLLEHILPRVRSVISDAKLYLVGSDLWVELAKDHTNLEVEKKTPL